MIHDRTQWRVCAVTRELSIHHGSTRVLKKYDVSNPVHQLEKIVTIAFVADAGA